MPFGADPARRANGPSLATFTISEILLASLHGLCYFSALQLRRVCASKGRPCLGHFARPHSRNVCPAQQAAASPQKSTSGTISSADRERALGILDGVSKGIQSLYYDPKMNGRDWKASLARARLKIAESNSLNEALTQIAIAVSELNDSHTQFEPPARPYGLDFGFDYRIFWSACLVTRVRPGSDAEAKGLKPGQQILSINGTAPTRLSLSNIEYLDEVLSPRPEMLLEIDSPTTGKQKLTIKAKDDHVFGPGGVPTRCGGPLRHHTQQPECRAPYADAVGAGGRNIYPQDAMVLL